MTNESSLLLDRPAPGCEDEACGEGGCALGSGVARGQVSGGYKAASWNLSCFNQGLGALQKGEQEGKDTPPPCINAAPIGCQSEFSSPPPPNMQLVSIQQETPQTPLLAASLCLNSASATSKHSDMEKFGDSASDP